MTLNIVLVEPQIPQNTGNVARTCAATGTRLHLVGPMGFKIDDSKLKRAGLDYWHMLDISHYKDISEFFAKYEGGILNAPGSNPGSALGLTPDSTPDSNPSSSLSPNPGSAPDTSGHPFYYFSTKAHQMYTEPLYSDNAYIVFGSETKGLDENLLRCNAAQCVRFPIRPGARSLNLSNAVAVGVFEVLRQWGFPELHHRGTI